MSAKTIRRHECDNCKIQYDEIEGEGFIPCGGPDNWSAWEKIKQPIRQEGTASYFYGASSGPEFCSYKCAIEWMHKEEARLKDNVQGDAPR